MKTSGHLLLALTTILALATIPVALAQEKDKVEECEGWSAAGECTLNPRYMVENCPIACAERAELDKQMAEAIGE